MAMSSEINSLPAPTTGADAVDEAIAKGIDLDGSPILCFTHNSHKL